KNTINYYIETLLALCSYQNVNSVIQEKNSSDISEITEENGNEKENLKKLHLVKSIFDNLLTNSTVSNLQLKCLNLLFELRVRYFYALETSLNDSFIKNSVEKFTFKNETNLWSIYKLARMCVRYTYYDLAKEIYESLSSKMTGAILNMSTSDLSYKSWFDFMSILCKSECALIKSEFTSINDLISKLNKSLCDYMKAHTIFKSLCSRCLTHTSSAIPTLENSNTCFQTRYCELRCEHIKLYIHLIMSLMTFQTIPAPVFQFKSSENFARYGRIAQQMKYTINELQKLNLKYKDFISECFDADEHTINILNIFKKQIECLIYCINLLITPKTQQQLEEDFYTNFLDIKLNLENQKSNSKFVQYSAELKIVENFFFNQIEKLKTLCTNDSESKTNHIKQFQSIVIDFIQLPIPLPRAFFTSLQKTSIKLLVSPNNKKTNSILTIRNDQTLVVKIDGIINQQFKNKSPIRTIKKVQICVTTELDSKSIPDNKFNNIKFVDVKTMLEEPKNDYFNSNVLINFPYFGNYVIQVDLYMLDNTDMIWRYTSSEKHQILVKIEEDPTRQKLFAAMAAAAAASTSNQSAGTPTGNNPPLIYQQNRNVIESDSLEKMDI
ncbi:unnamed protein product, partial [Brachionus calyciflorus]